MGFLALYLAAIMIVCVHGDGTSPFHCHEPEKVAILEKYTVKEDPTAQIAGTFSEVWVKKYHQDLDTCSYVTYDKQNDGRIKQTSVFKNIGGNGGENNPEYMKKTAKVGVYDVNGNYLATNEEYFGKMYILYSDANALTYYVCEINGVGWNAAVQVKSSLKEKLLPTAGDNEVQKSLKAAKAAMDQLTKEYGDVKDGEMISYKMEDLCP